MKCQGRLFIGLISSVLLFSCGTKEEKKAASKQWASFPVAIYADSAILADGNAQSDFFDAIDFWDSHAGRKVFDYRGAWDTQTSPYVGDALNPSAIIANVVFLQSPWNFSSNIAGQTVILFNSSGIHGSMIMINPNVPFCTGDCPGNFGTSRRKVFAHELGHFIGLDHNSNDPSNIMYPQIQPGGSLNALQIDSTSLQNLVR
ncbi:MAG: M10 family metallopeptidase domain-containing protein [Oligoflexia bacterium]|nr:M10 family metallopeptidase domain-containing protein [Oligoflexia bacterium]